MKNSDNTPKPTVALLDNGMRVVACRSVGNAASYIGVVVNAGSRDEARPVEGLAHFVEHTIFKGTLKRRSFHISNRMESIGGELNAYTSKEETVIYTNAPVGYAERALDLLADLVINSQFPAKELDMERTVVIEEIKSYLDSPADTVYDRYEELIYEGSGLSHNILGTPESVSRLGSDDCRAFLERFYQPENMVLYISDPMPVEKSLRLAEKYFGRAHFPGRGEEMSRRVLEIGQPRTTPAIRPPFRLTEGRDGYQSHTITGCRLFPRTDPRRFALYLLNNYLGGPSMNSRLNQELRDRRGLVYSVDSNFSLLSDTGLLTIYMGSGHETVGKCLKLVDREITRLAETELSQRTLDKIREQFIGQMMVSADNRENRAMSMAKKLMYYGEVTDLDTQIARLREVTPAALREVAELLTVRSTLTLS
ncbi:MAG: insulinase family protein [Bacteroides sp.]|nr:insulinase family protein [Bacteroides sp.]